ncbi:glutamine-hydrolyzing GMP synthase [Patescibacteria group bacterium]|nr:glutamine-hydrolyzing GMP synthase [Patescibacteria group bacterium]
MIAVVDYGSQYSHLIARRIRSLGVASEIISPQKNTLELKNIEGIILSGGPSSVYKNRSPRLSDSLLKLNVPILGICYGMQLLAEYFGGRVAKSKSREYGKETIFVNQGNDLFKGLSKRETVWLSHGDKVEKLPKEFRSISSSRSCPIAGFFNRNKNIYAVQFHPEVVHTENGQTVLKNFVFKICRAKKSWNVKDQATKIIKDLREEIGSEKVLIGVSGGVDSLVAANLLHRAIGNKLYAVFIDHGLLRKDEAEEVEVFYKKGGFKHFLKVDASKLFLKKLKGVTDPEGKRKIIGYTFIKVFEDVAKTLGKKDKIAFFAQGTIYPDRIESGASSKQAAKIKSHHNLVLPKKLKFQVIEPLADFYKDEVREIGERLRLPKESLFRHPFPGPGLAVRILGEVSPNRLEILQEADAIYIEELKRAKLYDKIWQAFAALVPVKSVGVMGDSRTYQYMISLRAVTSVDGMTADWFKMPLDVLERVSSRIVNEVKGVNRVVYDITQKPPATIEYE